MKYRSIFIIIVFLLIISLCFIGCGEDVNNILSPETLNVTALNTSQTTIGVGDTMTVEADFTYSGDITVLMFTWSATGGKIRGSGSTVVYEAPNTPGSYSISVKVTDGAISSGKTVTVRVTQESPTPSIIIDQNTYWSAEAVKDKLAYDVKVTKIATGKVTLHFEITQDKDDFDAQLSIEINGKVVLPRMFIGAEQPSTGKITVRDIDVSKVITTTGRYTINLYIEPGNRAKNGWLLNELKLVGVEGSSDPQQ
ncbi:TPA: hypothetical protein ENS27_11725 [bacterium]|nr:hypothetical protein [bacterium]